VEAPGQLPSLPPPLKSGRAPNGETTVLDVRKGAKAMKCAPLNFWGRGARGQKVRVNIM